MGLLQNNFRQGNVKRFIDKITSPVLTVSVTSPGSGYTVNSSVFWYLNFDGINGGAAASANLIVGTVNATPCSAIGVIVTNGGSYDHVPVITVTSVGGGNASITNNAVFSANLNFDTFYVYAGRSSKFESNTANPDPEYLNDYDGSMFQKQQMYFGKKINPTDVAYMVPRNTWAANTIYAEYDDKDRAFYSETSYAITSAYRVYKCLFNNGGSPSTIEPNSVLSGVSVRYADGIRWMYLYTLDSSSNTLFTTTDYIPVVNTAPANSASSNGAIFNVKVLVSGSGYPSTNGVLIAVPPANSISYATGATTTIQIANTASATTNFYANCMLTMFASAGGGSVQNRIIASSTSNSSGKFVSIYTSYVIPSTGLDSIVAVTGDSYQIAPQLKLTGDGYHDGFANNITRTQSTWNGYAVMNETIGSISRVEIVSPGLNYSRGNIQVITSTGFGSGGSLRPVFSPDGGHGSDIPRELGCQHLGVTCTLNSNTFPLYVELKTIGILRNPKIYNDAANTFSLYTRSSFNSTLELASASVGSPLLGELMISTSASGSPSSGTVAFSNSSFLALTGVSCLGNVTDTFKNNIMTGMTSGAVVTVSGVLNGNGVLASNASISQSNTFSNTFDPFSGKVIFIDNIQAAARSNSSSEQLKLVVRM
jgi:hypothetical protein